MGRNKDSLMEAAEYCGVAHQAYRDSITGPITIDRGLLYKNGTESTTEEVCDCKNNENQFTPYLQGKVKWEVQEMLTSQSHCVDNSRITIQTSSMSYIYLR